jgi:DNA-binding LytR/AlgR family response regulator
MTRLARTRDSLSANGDAVFSKTAESLVARVTAALALPSILAGQRDHRLYMLKTDGIEYIQSDGNYVKLHADKAEYLSRDSVKRLANVLVDRGFIRIERSILINVRAIVYAQRGGRGTFLFTLKSGSQLRSGAKYRNQILKTLPLSTLPVRVHPDGSRADDVRAGARFK